MARNKGLTKFELSFIIAQSKGGTVKKLLALLLVLGFTGALYGQLTPCVGAKVGVNYDVFSTGVEGADSWSGLGYNFGLELGLHVMPMLGIDIGGSYFISNYSYSIDTVDYESSINSIYIPLALRYHFGAAPMVHPYVRFGGAAMIQMSGDVDGTDIPDDELGTDFYILGGLGLDWKAMPTFSIRPDITFQYNLTANDSDTPDSESGYDILFDVGFFYWF